LGIAVSDEDLQQLLGDPIAGLVFSAVADANALVARFNQLLTQSHGKFFLFTEEELERMKFALMSAGMMLSKVWEENQQYVEAIEKLKEGHHELRGDGDKEVPG
jgi:hypothetical protein